MRIAFVGPVPPLRGGIAQHGGKLIEALQDLGHDVSVLSWASQYPSFLYPGEEQRDGGTATVPGASYELRWWAPLTWWRAGRAARAADLVVVPWIMPFQALALRTIASSARPTPTVAIVHNPVPHEHQPLTGPLTRFAFRAFQGAVVHGHANRDLLHELVPDLPVRVALHPPNLEMRASAPPPRDPLKLLFFGFIRPYKGIEVLLDAVRGMEGLHEVRLTIAGDIWGDAERWLTEIDRRGLRDKIDLRGGYVPDEEVGALFAEHHVIVAPYRSATQSGVIPLAYAASRPVVATRVGGLTDQVEDGVTGALCAPGDPDSLRRAIMRVARSYDEMWPAVRQHMPEWTDVAAALVGVGLDRSTGPFGSDR